MNDDRAESILALHDTAVRAAVAYDQADSFESDASLERLQADMETTRAALESAVREALAAPQQESPQGWQLVPIKPTSAMLSVAVNMRYTGTIPLPVGGRTSVSVAALDAVWREMLAAAPECDAPRPPRLKRLTEEQTETILSTFDVDLEAWKPLIRAVERALAEHNGSELE